MFLNLLSHVGEAISKNPGFLKLRRIRAAQNIAKTVRHLFLRSLISWLNVIYFQISQAQNNVYLDASSLMLNIGEDQYQK